MLRLPPPPLRRRKYMFVREKEKRVPKEQERGEKLALPAHRAGGIGRLCDLRVGVAARLRRRGWGLRLMERRWSRW